MNKPRPPKLDVEKVSKTKPDNLTQLKSRLEFFENERNNKTLPTTYIALEALSALYGGRLEGYSDDDLRTSWPKEWGDQTISVPAVLIQTLASAWLDYQDAPHGKTLGEAFKLEGGGQGKKKIKDTLKTIDNNRSLSHQVEINYLTGDETSQPISLEEAYVNVSEENSVSFDTVRNAHLKYGKDLRKKLKALGIIIE